MEPSVSLKNTRKDGKEVQYWQHVFEFCATIVKLQSNQVKRTPQEYINEFIIQKLNPLLVVDFRLISAFLHV